MPHQEGLIDLCLSEPAFLLSGEEDFHSYFLFPPFSHPDFSISPFPDLFNHLNLPGNGALNLVRTFGKKVYSLLKVKGKVTAH